MIDNPMQHITPYPLFESTVEQRWALARDPNAPAEALVQLSRDVNTDVRQAAEENSNFPEDLTWWALGGDDSWL